jgi:hypothetical protein
MVHYDDNGQVPGALKTPLRNHYFYGKLLDTRHFNLEQDYFNHKLALITRLVLGYGVVCGLDLALTDERDQVIVRPGMAIDKWGRVIVVPRPSKPIRVERSPEASGEEEEWIHLCLAYYECESDPTPVLAGECDVGGSCAADTIQERYKIFSLPERAPLPEHKCTLEDFIDSQGIRFEALARWVSMECPSLPADPCIPLGDIFIPEEGTCHTDDLHIERRPIVYSNDLLYELVLGLIDELQQARRRGGRS